MLSSQKVWIVVYPSPNTSNRTDHIMGKGMKMGDSGYKNSFLRNHKVPLEICLSFDTGQHVKEEIIEFFSPWCRSLSSFSLPNVIRILCNPSRFERDRSSGPRL